MTVLLGIWNEHVTVRKTLFISGNYNISKYRAYEFVKLITTKTQTCYWPHTCHLTARFFFLFSTCYGGKVGKMLITVLVNILHMLDKQIVIIHPFLIGNTAFFALNSKTSQSQALIKPVTYVHHPLCELPSYQFQYFLNLCKPNAYRTR